MLPLQMLDFNGDRLTDVILVANDGIYGWAQVRPLALVPVAILSAERPADQWQPVPAERPS